MVLDLTRRKLKPGYASVSILDMLTGINSYWDSPYNNFNYSYVDVATDQYKYCTLSYDRLGIGNSSHGEPLNEIQASLEVAALAQLTMMLRNGTFPGVKQAFKKVTHVGCVVKQFAHDITKVLLTISLGIHLAPRRHTRLSTCTRVFPMELF